MPQCYVITCGNYYEKTRGTKDIIYHMLPGDPVLALKWIRACGKKEPKLPYYARVCSNHFSEKCYQRDLQHELLGLPLRRKLKPGAIPDRNLPKHQKHKLKEESTSKAVEILKSKEPPLLNEVTKPEIKKSACKPSIFNYKPEKADIQPKKKIQNKLKVPATIISQQKNMTRKTVIINSSPEISEIEILAQNSMPAPRKSSTKIFDFKPPKDESQDVLREKEDKDRSTKINNKLNKLPMRSSFRIAKKKSIETLSDSFTEKVNSKSQACNKPEKFSDKLKFMAKLQLKFERKENFVTLPKYDLKMSLGKMVKQECFSSRYLYHTYYV